jgi:glycosyltransferase involved in cell wall biosynthesis
MKVFLSHRIGPEKNIVDSKPTLVMGAANYSWKIVSNMYDSALKNLGFKVDEIVRPEIFQTEIARNLLNFSDNDVHIAVKPIEHLRYMAGVRNFYVCGWEFPQFSTSDYGISPFLNQIKTLSSAEKVLCWSTYTASNLERYGIEAISFPPPVLAGLPNDVNHSILEKLHYVRLNSIGKGKEVKFFDHRHLSDLRNSGAKVFLTVLNPFDLRKSLPIMLEGFTKFIKEGGNAILIVKLIIDNKLTTVNNINEILNLHYRLNLFCDRVFFLGDQLSTDELSALYQWIEFYLCTSSAEGLNIPLIEAINLGAFPVSTFNTAMLDYLDNSSSVEISSGRQKFDGAGHSLASYLQVDHFATSSSAITTALNIACNLPLDVRTAMIKQARSNIADKYSMTAFSDNWNALVI